VSETPSARRRKGREAYYRGGNPNDHNPYQFNSGVCSQRIDWLEGWQEASAADAENIKLEAARDELRDLPISLAIDAAQTDDDVKEILRRIAEHVGME
jgi:ribosome modulation factor